MSACFAIISSIASTTLEVANNIRAQVKEYFIFKTENFSKTCCGLKNNLNLTKKKIVVNSIL